MHPAATLRQHHDDADDEHHARGSAHHAKSKSVSWLPGQAISRIASSTASLADAKDGSGGGAPPPAAPAGAQAAAGGSQHGGSSAASALEQACRTTADEARSGLLQKDAFLVFRALCKLSIRTSDSNTAQDPTAVRWAGGGAGALGGI